MNFAKIFAALSLLTATTASLAAGAQTQYQHDRAVQSQRRHDHRHHTGAKVVGGSAAGGAVVGALAGGGKGALIGGAVGAGGGAIANKVRVDKGVKARENRSPQ